ncbi:hypothetical protein J8273_3236 [Carpediemonas membranifera]|uniref:Uncharacterized protein n=1 Tax=Carpediemonas membranifera TaxID=201153 RepID=A0A8J6B566_9EUKA|nr:hypothetical protein J8273_3236 [Carpediemonas membranifera]|eukprot:KAG9393107.1 hypothetical protein J8273_3236 [Carpediemonas membranifera]
MKNEATFTVMQKDDISVEMLMELLKLDRQHCIDVILSKSDNRPVPAFVQLLFQPRFKPHDATAPIYPRSNVSDTLPGMFFLVTPFAPVCTFVLNTTDMQTLVQNHALQIHPDVPLQATKRVRPGRLTTLVSILDACDVTSQFTLETKPVDHHTVTPDTAITTWDLRIQLLQTQVAVVLGELAGPSMEAVGTAEPETHSGGPGFLVTLGARGTHAFLNGDEMAELVGKGAVAAIRCQ